jgi:NAD(P)-dependent dehydrogenase (short-subunit alcohol dehydrogenase family)
MNVFDLFKLDGRRALLTGGSKGLGREIAMALAQAGADVVITSRNADQCAATARAISEATGRRATPIAANVAKAADVERLFQEATRGGERVDILVNSAGLNIRNPVQDLSEADWDTVIDVNLKGPFLLARQFGAAMAANGWGRIVHLGSIMSLVAIPDRAPYASSKAGVRWNGRPRE